ncbi:hypothetical protein [Phytoactinopolyspora mesophila]|uniref:Uncharacterized protein n=1 Tax=Phytoactinopolyspora mesophila TaxID=2650750 RepID=A0A7K3M0K3_9ACTN|nr:hypothetical protein [Phytoactinopolyspora mesophila]NDL56804.1 hypothetical protein [Phytoactinopolyspora mesophila]
MSLGNPLDRVPWWVWVPLLAPLALVFTVMLGWFPVVAGLIGWLVVRLLRQQPRRLSTPQVNELAGQPAEVIEPILHTMSNEDLCRLWENSSRAVRSAYLPASISSHVRLRQALLDEMERRDPEAMDRWLADRPDQSDPRTYIDES